MNVFSSLVDYEEKTNNNATIIACVVAIVGTALIAGAAISVMGLIVKKRLFCFSRSAEEMVALS